MGGPAGRQSSGCHHTSSRCGPPQWGSLGWNSRAIMCAYTNREVLLAHPFRCLCCFGISDLSLGGLFSHSRPVCPERFPERFP